jgi:hypothetical protein
MVGGNYSGAARSLQLSIQDQTVNIQQGFVNQSTEAFDELSSAVAISSLPYYRAGGFNGLTSNRTDPVHSCTGSADLTTGWFIYTASASQQIDVMAAAGGSPTALTVYRMQNSSLGGEIGCDTNSFNLATNPSLQFGAVAGNRYAIEISGVGEGLGSIGRVTLTVQPLPTVAISCGFTSVAPGQGMQCAATVTSTPNAAVRWTAQNGSIDANGNYTAPANLSPGQTLIDLVTARSFADPNASASVTVTVQM